MKTIKVVVFLLLLSCLVSCGQLNRNNALNKDLLHNSVATASAESNLAEVAPPIIIKNLERKLEKYTPQVNIIAPQADQIFDQTNIEIVIEVEDLPVFRDDKLGLGNHVNLVVDKEPLQSVYSLDEPILIKNLAPGTHTIRAFAVRPWGECFKNKEAYAQTTFSILTSTDDNHPQPSVPLLTYSSPTGTIGAEPLLLDYYLTNIEPNELSANNQNVVGINVRATVNGSSFILEDWQPRYLTGLKLGENWIQLELIDEAGNKIENSFNDTVKIVSYDPQQQDSLAKLFSNKIDLAEAQSIVEQKYYIQPVGTPEIIDLEDSAEPEADIETTDKLIEPQLSDRSEDNTQGEEPAISAPPILESEQPEMATPTVDFQQNIATKINSPSASKDIADTSPTSDLKTMPITAEMHETIKGAEVTEATPHQEESVVDKIDIVIPEIDSIEIDESEIVIKTPQIQPEQDSKELETNQPVSLWWKKLLVNLRRTIEAIANKLPGEA